MRLNFLEIANLIIKDLPVRIRQSQALNIYADKQQSFENWVNVEVMEILINAGFENLLPEKYAYDIFSQELIIEIKIIRSGWPRIDVDMNKLVTADQAPDAIKMFMFLYYPINVKTKTNFIKKIKELENRFGRDRYISTEFHFRNESLGYMGFILA